MSKMRMTKTACHLAAVAALAGFVAPALATNGMYMEGYGPIATGMGGASQAIDHGNAAMAQNPATLGLMADGTSRVDVALGILGPDVSSSMPAFGLSADSGGTSYIMPAFGYAKRNGPLTWGVGMFAQGGMGTEYSADSFISNPGAMTGAFTMLESRSELGVGNVIFPVAYQVNPNFTVGATLKFLWSTLDMQMTAPVNSLMGMVQGSGTMPTGNLGAALPMLANANWARISFSDGSDFSGAAKATGFSAALGMTYKINDQVRLGGSYQFKTNLGDLETGDSSATLSADLMGFSDSGKITVIDFQMPAVFAIGATWQATPALLLAADVKRIGWSSVMEKFRMRFDSAGMGGSVDFAMPQNWENQTVLNLGLAYKVNDALTLRGGVNLSDNPVPDAYVNPLFPATVEKHYTMGFGYKFSKVSEVNAAVTLAPKVTVTSGAGPEISHSQTNWQFMYSHSF